jgi:hypothetical protein
MMAHFDNGAFASTTILVFGSEAGPFIRSGGSIRYQPDMSTAAAPHKLRRCVWRLLHRATARPGSRAVLQLAASLIRRTTEGSGHDRVLPAVAEPPNLMTNPA